MSQAGSNAYYYNWHPTSSQRGLGIQALEPLKVTAVGSDGSRNAILSTYVSQHEASTYNQLSNNWQIMGTADEDYNCLAYALGITNANIWPWENFWGQYAPTVSQVDSYMASQGYTRTSMSIFADVVAYYEPGQSTYVGHFSKKYNGAMYASKWGRIEVMATTINPYTNITGGYGYVAAMYKKN